MREIQRIVRIENNRIRDKGVYSVVISVSFELSRHFNLAQAERFKEDFMRKWVFKPFSTLRHEWGTRLRGEACDE